MCFNLNSQGPWWILALEARIHPDPPKKAFPEGVGGWKPWKLVIFSPFEASWGPNFGFWGGSLCSKVYSYIVEAISAKKIGGQKKFWFNYPISAQWPHYLWLADYLNEVDNPDDVDDPDDVDNPKDVDDPEDVDNPEDINDPDEAEDSEDVANHEALVNV